MRVLEFIQRENDQTTYSTEFISYYKETHGFIIRIRRHDTNESFVVEMNHNDIDALEKYNHLKELWQYAQKKSEGYFMLGIMFYNSDHSRNDIGISINWYIEPDEYLQTYNGFVCFNENDFDRRHGMKIYWLSKDNPITHMLNEDDIIDELGGEEKIKNDIMSDIKKYYGVDI